MFENFLHLKKALLKNHGEKFLTSAEQNGRIQARKVIMAAVPVCQCGQPYQFGLFKNTSYQKDPSPKALMPFQANPAHQPHS